MSDQAEGLRSLFTRRTPTLVVVAGSDVAKAAVALRIASEAAATGAGTLIVDGTPGRVARVAGVHCRYELADVASGDVAIGDVLRRVASGVHLLPAARALGRANAFSDEESARVGVAFANGISRAFSADGAATIDRIVVHAADGRATRAIEAFGRNAKAVIVASDDRASLHGAYFEMKALAQAGVSHFELVARPAGTVRAALAYSNLEETARRFLDIELIDGGSIAWPATRDATTSLVTSILNSITEEEAYHAAIG
jgi:MinD-like ATPase involved in chromosome partitioning or flagellar assembly